MSIIETLTQPSEWSSITLAALPVFLVLFFIIWGGTIAGLHIVTSNWGDSFTPRTPEQQRWVDFGDNFARQCQKVLGLLIGAICVCLLIDAITLVSGDLPWYETLRR